MKSKIYDHVSIVSSIKSQNKVCFYIFQIENFEFRFYTTFQNNVANVGVPMCIVKNITLHIIVGMYNIFYNP